MSNELDFRMNLFETYNKLNGDPLLTTDKIEGRSIPQMQDFFRDEESL